jgi:WD40 repeat protein
MLLFEDHRYESPAVNHRAVVHAIAFSPDGSTLATGAKDGSVFLRDSTGHVSPLFERGPKSLPVYAIDYLPDGSGVVIGGEFGWATWKQEGAEWRPSGSAMPRPVTSLAVLDGRRVAFGIGDRRQSAAGTLELWDTSADRKLPDYFLEPNGVRVVVACPARKLVAWVTHHRKVRVWDMTKPKSTATDFMHDKECPTLALSADGKSLAVAVDYAVKLYDVERKCERALLRGHAGKVSAVAFSPDGRTLMTGSWDETVRLWDVATGRERANFKWGVGRVYCVAYAPDGLRLAAGGDLGSVVVWDAE